MAVPILQNQDFNKTELLNARIQNLGVDPAGLTAGDKGLLWIDGPGVMKYWDGTQIQTVGLATGGNAETLNGQGPSFYLNRANHTGNIPNANVTGLGSLALKNGIATADVSDDSITFAKVEDIATGTILGRTAAGVGNIEELSATAIRTLLNVENGATADQTKADIDALNVDAGTLDGLDSTAFELLSRKNQANGYAGLDANGMLSSGQIPALGLTDVNVVANITARDALTVQEGDVAIVTGDRSYIYDGTAWVELQSAADGILTLGVGAGLTSTGGVNPVISVTAGGIGTTQLADAGVTAAKLGVGAVDLATTKVGGVLPGTKGGTGQSTFAVGDLLQGAAGNTLMKLAAAAAGNVLISGGAGAASSWGKVGLTTHVAGTLPIANGGTGATTVAAARTALGIATIKGFDIGGGATGEYTVQHDFNTYDVQVQVRRNTGARENVIVDIERPTLNTVLVRFAQPQAAASFRVLVEG